MTPLQEVDALRDELEKLTGKRPRSRSLLYLRALADRTRAAKKAGEDVRKRDEHAVPISLSMLPEQRDAMLSLCDVARISGSSQLVRRALAAYALQLGRKTIARTFDAEYVDVLDG